MSRSPTGLIYRVTNTQNGKAYVGQTTVSVARRWVQHCCAARKGSMYALHAALRKYGEKSFKVEPLVSVFGDFQDVLRAEMGCIRQEGSKYPEGYNLTDGGEGLDWSDPVLRERHLRAVREASQRDSWKKAQIEGAKKRTASPRWQAKNEAHLKKMHADPEWQAAMSRHLQEVREDPSHKQRFSAAMKERARSEWKTNHRKAMVNMHADPVFAAQRDARFNVARAQRTREALLRDATYSPVEAARRQRRRETARARYALRKAQEPRNAT